MLHFYVSERCADEKLSKFVLFLESIHFIAVRNYSLKFALLHEKFYEGTFSDFWIKTSAGVITVVVRKYVLG